MNVCGHGCARSKRVKEPKFYKPSDKNIRHLKIKEKEMSYRDIHMTNSINMRRTQTKKQSRKRLQ